MIIIIKGKRVEINESSAYVQWFKVSLDLTNRLWTCEFVNM